MAAASAGRRVCDAQMSRMVSEAATIRASVLDLLVRTLDVDRRDATTELLARHGLTRVEIRDPYASVQLSRYVAFFEAAARLSNDPTLGARLGIMTRPKDLGPLGFLFSTAPNLRTALERLSRWVGALQGSTQARLEVRSGMAIWSYRIEDDTVWPRRQDAEYSLAATCSLARMTLGSGWSPSEVHFEHPEPADRTAAERVFRTTLRFRQATNRLIVESDDADRMVGRDDPDLTRYLQHHVEDLASEHPERSDIVDRTRALIAASMGMARITVALVAKDLGCSERTLQRDLSRRGTSLRQLIQEHRRSMLAMRLGEEGLSHAKLAHALGYADETVFWRAFKQWTGKPPSRSLGQKGRGEAF